MRSAMQIWLRWMMCWRLIVWHGKLLMSGWRAWRNELEFLVSVMVGTSLSYHSLRVTTSPGMRHAGNWEWRPPFSSCCRLPALRPTAYRLSRQLRCSQGATPN